MWFLNPGTSLCQVNWKPPSDLGSETVAPMPNGILAVSKSFCCVKGSTHREHEHESLRNTTSRAIKLRLRLNRIFLGVRSGSSAGRFNTNIFAPLFALECADKPLEDFFFAPNRSDGLCGAIGATGGRVVLLGASTGLPVGLLDAIVSMLENHSQRKHDCRMISNNLRARLGLDLSNRCFALCR